MPKPVRLSPGQALSLWYDQQGNEESKVIAFANALANHYLKTNHRHVPLADLKLPTLYYGALRRAGYKWIHEVAPLPETSLRTIRHIGSVGATVITDSIARFHRDKN